MKTRRIIAIAGGAVAAIIALVVLVILPIALAPVRSPPIARTPADVGLAFEDVEFRPSDQPITIRAWWIPADQPVASVLFVHSANANREDIYFGALDYYRALHERRIDVLTIDLRNHGASDKSASGHLTFGRDEQHEARAALEWLRAKRPGLRIFGSAASMGGATLLHLAVAGGRFEGLVLFDPALNYEDTITGGVAAAVGVPRALAIPTAWSLLHFVRLETLPADPLDAAQDLNLPILLFQDESDPVARVPFARTFAERNEHVELHVIGNWDDDAVRLSPGAWGTHLSAFRRQPKRVMEAIDRFVALH